VVIALTSSNRNNGVVLRLSCETDFVSKGESFIDFAKSIAEIALKKLPAALEDLLALPYDGSLSIQDKITEQVGVIGEKVEVKEYAKIETAPGAGQVIPYIHMGYRAGVIVALNQEGPDLTGRLNKFFKETTLINQVFVKNSKETIGSYLKSKHPELTVTEFKHISLA